MEDLKTRLEKNIYFNSKDNNLCSKDCRYFKRFEKLELCKCSLFFEGLKSKIIDNIIFRCDDCKSFFFEDDIKNL